MDAQRRPGGGGDAAEDALRAAPEDSPGDATGDGPKMVAAADAGRLADADRPTIVVEPAVLPAAGLAEFTIWGGGFDPRLETVYTLVCTLPGATVSAAADKAGVQATLDSMGYDDCHRDTAAAVDLDADGAFMVERSADAGPNFVWVASSWPEAQAAAAAVLLETLPYNPWDEMLERPVPAMDLWPGGDPDGVPYPADYYCRADDPAKEPDCWFDALDPQKRREHWRRPAYGWQPPSAGDVPAVHPDTPVPEWGDGSVDPTSPRYDHADQPRETSVVAAVRRYCDGLRGPLNCRWHLFSMYQALDYLGADQWCIASVVLQRLDYYEANPIYWSVDDVFEDYGWHLCATVIDPIVVPLPEALPATDVGYRLSDTPGITLAERCRAVLVDPFPDIQLEERSKRTDGVYSEPDYFGQDCDAWAAHVTAHPEHDRFPVCTQARSLAEEWMEHQHGQHDLYSDPIC